MREALAAPVLCLLPLLLAARAVSAGGGRHGGAPAGGAPAVTYEGNAAQWVLVIHGGAGVERRSLEPELEPPSLAALREALRRGRDVLAGGGSSLDAVETV